MFVVRSSVFWCLLRAVFLFVGLLLATRRLLYASLFVVRRVPCAVCGLKVHVVYYLLCVDRWGWFFVCCLLFVVCSVLFAALRTICCCGLTVLSFVVG